MLAVILISSCCFCSGLQDLWRFSSKKMWIRRFPNHSRYQKEDGVTTLQLMHRFFLGIIFFHCWAGQCGPILVTILDGVLGFGFWLEQSLWGVHDFSSTFMSIRHGGRSVADVIENLFRIYRKLFFSFNSCSGLCNCGLSQPHCIHLYQAACGSHIFRLVCARCLGFLGVVANKHFQLGPRHCFSFLSLLGLLVGHYFPFPSDKDVWILATLIYCFVAAVLPVGILYSLETF